jgi:multidrug efflux pump subunit AcrA (membrane-fusion protein)
MAQEQRTYPTWRRQEASSVIFRKQKEKTVSYALGFLYGHVLRLRPGANLAAVAALSILVSGCNRGQATVARPVPEVEVATVETRDVPVYGEWVATLDGYVNAEIRPQVSGYIIKQNYKEGSLVHEGQVLFEIDPRPFQATLDRTKGDLAQAQAQLGKATLDVERDTPLAEGRAIAKSQLDNEVQAKLGAQASVESAKAAGATQPGMDESHLSGEWNCGDSAGTNRQSGRTQLYVDFSLASGPDQSFFPD